MKKHSSYLDKKREFITKNDSLSSELFDFYKEIYLAQEAFSDSIAGETLTSFKVEGGAAPFLKSEEIDLGEEIVSSLQELLGRITSSVTKINPGMNFDHLKDLFKSSASGILKSTLEHDFDKLEKISSDARLAPDEFLFVMHNVFKPLLVSVREFHDVSIGREEWLKGECPFCGYFPDFSKIVELRDNQRKLHCSLCENEWEFPRLKCHACGTDSQESLGYFEYEDNPDYRVYFCNSCRKYIKCIRIQKVKDESSCDLAVEDIVTGFLDVTMMDKDYNRL